MEYAYSMWEVEYTDEFCDWWDSLSWKEQATIDSGVKLLEEHGPALPYPYSSSIKNARHNSMRELRSQCEGRPLRTLYIFDPTRVAVLLIGGDKTGDDRFYETLVPKADKIYDEYLKEKQEEKHGNP